MAWLFGQVWVLCAVAFLAGSAVTWFAVRRRPVPVVPGRHSVPLPTPEPPAEAWESSPVQPVPGPAADSALAALDTRELSGRLSGVSATGALDMIGVPASRERRAAEADTPVTGLPVQAVPPPRRPVE